MAMSVPASISTKLSSILSPLVFYFCISSYDHTARVWSTDHIQPLQLRILAGHYNDVQVSHLCSCDQLTPSLRVFVVSQISP